MRRLTWKERGHLSTLAWRARSLLGHTVIQPGESLGELAESGTDVLLIAGPEEIRPFLYSGVRAVRRAQRNGRLRMEEIPTLDHGLAPSKDRDEITRLTIDHVISNFR